VGGHALGAFGIPNANNALGRAIAKIAEIQVPSQPKTVFNVGVVSGGVSVNAIPSESSMLIDMRSVDGAVLETLVAQVKAACQQALEEELARWNHPTETLTLTCEALSIRPGGSQSETDPIAQAAKAANDAIGFATKFGGGSTDANIPISLGVPGVAIGRGGTQHDGHAVTERFLPTDAYKGPQRAFLLALELVGFKDICQPVLQKRNG
ncbi:MAG: peptidase dimerization domain-containing protein, partial [Firmicutes bacterium]|nr:peptidase dimerization domain-containing protein [Bacillota bacterium]